MKRQNRVRLNVRIEKRLYDKLQGVVGSSQGDINLTEAAEWAIERGVEAIQNDPQPTIDDAPLTYKQKGE